MHIKKIILLSLLCAYSLISEEPAHYQAHGDSYPMCNIEGEPSSVVAGCVNVVSGDFFDIQRDLVLEGPEPLIVERCYSSSDFLPGELGNGWHFNFPNGLRGPLSVEHGLIFEGSFGAEITFGRKGKRVMSPVKDLFINGVTNNGSGLISAKTNLKNLRLNYIDKHNCKITYPGGKELFFRTSGHYNKGIYHYPVTEAYANGITKNFTHSGRRKLKTIKMLNRNNEFLQTLNFKRSSTNLIIRSHDERTVNYSIETEKCECGNCQEKIILNEVLRPNAPFERYKYSDKIFVRGKGVRQVIEKTRPDNRYVKIQYYDLNEENSCAMRVRSIQGPIGTTSDPYTAYHFQYHFPGDANKSGCCGVFNAHNIKTDYSWDEERRLKAVVRFNSQNVPYTFDQLYWGAKGTQDYTNLASHCYGSDQTHFCRCFIYDTSGNIKEEYFYGNLTGKNQAPLIIGENGYPIETGCERHVKLFDYLNDHLVYEKDGLHITTHSYHPGTDLIHTTYTWDNDKIVLRKAFFYDENVALIKEVTDDGNDADIDNLRGVTYRKLQYFARRKTAPFGFVDHVEEKVLNIATGEEVLEKAWINTYSLDGRLLRQDHFDANRQPLYLLQWEYDNHGNVTKEVNAMGQAIYRSYDANDNLIIQHGIRGDNLKKYYYDYSNRLIRIDEIHPPLPGEGQDHILSTHYRYDNLGQKIALIDAYGNETNYFYDDFGRMVESLSPLVFDETKTTTRPHIRWEYDALGNPITTIDPIGNVKRVAYTVRNQPYRIVYPDGSTEENEYSLQGLLISSKAKDGSVTRYTHDYQDRVILTQFFSPSGELLWSTSALYNALYLLAETDSMGHVTSYTYDIFGRKKSVEKGDSKVTFVYDGSGQCIEEITTLNDQESSHKVVAYDQLGRVVEERVEDDQRNILHCLHYHYDGDGNRTHVMTWGEEGQSVTEICYDSHGIPHVAIDALGNKVITQTRFDYRNELGQLVPYQEVIDPLGNLSGCVRDALGREVLFIKKDPFGELIQKREIAYDLVGNRARLIETVFTPEKPERSVEHRWEYDDMRHCLSYLQAVGSADEKKTFYSYNNLGQLTSVQKPSGVILDYTYNAQGLLADYKAQDNSFHYTYAYDAKQRPIEIRDEITLKSTKKIFDGYDRLTQIDLPQGYSMYYTYDRGGRVTKTTLPDGSSIGYRYRSSHLANVERYAKTGELLYAHSYNRYDLSGKVVDETFIGGIGQLTRKYDRKGRFVASKTALREETIPPNGYDAAGNLVHKVTSDENGQVDCHYGYDSLYQLTSETGYANHAYTYDSLYNRVAKDGDAWALNDLNQILNTKENVFIYDANGNLSEKKSAKESVKYAYDALDRLTEVKKDNQRIIYEYDANNHRISKKIQTGKREEIFTFLYDGDNEIGCIDAKGNITELRVLGIGLGAEIGAAVAMEFNANIYVPLHDHQGSVVALLNQEGAKVESYSYSAFGEEVNPKASISSWRFSSKRVDDETGFVFFGRRYYAPSLGRWITQDPKGFEGGPNLYAYVTNMPLTQIDMYGLVGEGMSRMERVRDSFERIGGRVREGFKTAGRVATRAVGSIIRATGTIIKTLGEQIPLPVVRDVIGLAGHLLMGEDLKTFVPFWKMPQRKMVAVDPVAIDLESIKMLAALMFNGQGSNKESARANLELAAQALGLTVQGYYNHSYGQLVDTLLSGGLISAGEKSTYSDFAFLVISEFIDKVEHLIIITHSQGALPVYYAIQKLSPDRQKKISLYNFTPAKIIPKGNLKECVNFVSILDPIPFIADPIGIARSFFDDDYKVEFLKPQWLCLDHRFGSKPVQDKLNEIGFIRKKGGQ